MESSFIYGCFAGGTVVAFTASFWVAKFWCGRADPLGVFLVLCWRSKWFKWAATSKDDWYLEILDVEMRMRSNV